MGSDPGYVSAVTEAIGDGTVAGERLTTFDGGSDGERVRLNFVDANGRRCSLSLPLEQLGALLMTIPRILRSALEARFGDDTRRFVHPLACWRLESVVGTEAVILNLLTPDGFDVSFSVAGDDARRLGAALSGTSATPSRSGMN
jgi:hypothetical protein